MDVGSFEGRDGDWVLREVFGLPEQPWFSMNRSEDKAFQCHDKRLGCSWRATHGYLAGLHKVSTVEQASEFAGKNRYTIIPEGGIYINRSSVAELLIRLSGLPNPESIDSDSDLFRIRTRDGIDCVVGYSSFIFQRLIGRPNQERYSNLPDSQSLATLVIRGVDSIENLADYAELALYHFREKFPLLNISFGNIHMVGHQGGCFIGGGDEECVPNLFDELPVPDRSRVMAFFNRGTESDSISGLLYYYRVIESCFDDILEDKIQTWRGDSDLDFRGLLTNVRNLQRDGEDRTSLRQVLGEIVDQKILDKSKSKGLISNAEINDLVSKVYIRRNSIAHGRIGKHEDVLVPYGISVLNDGKDHDWYILMQKLAKLALKKWILE